MEKSQLITAVAITQPFKKEVCFLVAIPNFKIWMAQKNYFLKTFIYICLEDYEVFSQSDVSGKLEKTERKHMKLYKYFPDNANSFKALSVRGLWCHYPNKMNDPADCLGYLDRDFSSEDVNLFKEYIAKSNDSDIKNIINYEDKKIIEFFNLQRRELIGKYAFTSLSESFDDILM